jgi:hypothetical protein
MGALKIKVDCRTEGPMANGEAEKAAQDWATNTTQAIADEGVRQLREWKWDRGGGQGRDTSGRFTRRASGRARGGFEAALKTTRVSPTLVRIAGPQQRGVAWSPWLEGTSKRNDSTGFKGYHLFRTTRTQLNKMAPDIAQTELEKVLPRMGGD